MAALVPCGGLFSAPADDRLTGRQQGRQPPGWRAQGRRAHAGILPIIPESGDWIASHWVFAVLQHRWRQRTGKFKSGPNFAGHGDDNDYTAMSRSADSVTGGDRKGSAGREGYQTMNDTKHTSSWISHIALMLLLAVGLASTGCQVELAGQTLPSPYYLTDDVQYYAPGPEFKLAREAAAMKEQRAAHDLGTNDRDELR